ncbi:MAG: MFS transporter [Desulfopila sp.]
MKTSSFSSPFAIANIRCFIAFRLFFNARFYYPVFTILFLDYGLTIEQFALLNSVWAATIVLAEVPSGALADLIGRKTLLLTTSLLMVGEMLLLSFVPLHNITLVFWAFLLNRILSGLAEAMASGADEALAYDSLVEQGDSDDWPVVLSVMMRIKSLGSIITMSLGALAYDPAMVNKVIHFFGSSTALSQQTTMRFPIYLTLILGILSCITAARMEETEQAKNTGEPARGHLQNAVHALKLTWSAGIWIVRTPFALVVILFGMGFDHVLRLLITMTSQYFRLIELPEAIFGIIGGSMAIVGLFVPKVAEKMVQRYSPLQNMLWLSAISLAALVGIAAYIPYWGILPVLLVSSGLMLTAFFTSHYLNRIAESHQRATILSFKGLAFNLAYGFIGVAFAGLMNTIRVHNQALAPELSEKAIENISFQSATSWLSPYTLIAIIVTILLARYLLRHTTVHRHRG